MPGLIAKKVGMTSIFDDNGKNIACTLIQTGPNVVTQVKTVETDGYTAIQVGFDEKKEKRTSAAMKGHFSKASTTPKRKVIEFVTQLWNANTREMKFRNLQKVNSLT